MNVESAVSGTLGGILIGLAASGLLLFCGRIAGISNIAAGLLAAQNSGRIWRLAFSGGLLTGGLSLLTFRPESFGATVTHSPLVLALAGFLVGLGSRIANGCTSGHGVCGLARRSLRSLFATLTFVGTGILTVYLFNQ
ncbi:MAG: YeeE/YedE thiosulfate transporter family protein [Methylotetracoccus sp.]